MLDRNNLPDATLSSPNLTPFRVLPGRNPRTALDTLLPSPDGEETGGDVHAFVDRQKQVFKETETFLERRHEMKAREIEQLNESVIRRSPGSKVKPGDLVLVRELDSRLGLEGLGSKLVHEKWTGPWTVRELKSEGSSATVEMNGRSKRHRHVTAADIKPFHARPPHLRHSIGDEFAMQAWDADLGLTRDQGDTAPLYTLLDRRRVSSPEWTFKWEYTGKCQDGKKSAWLSEPEALQSFTPLQLDVFHAIWDLYVVQGPKPLRKRKRRYSKSKALAKFPLGCQICFQKDGLLIKGIVTDYARQRWKVRLENGDHTSFNAEGVRNARESYLYEEACDQPH